MIYLLLLALDPQGPTYLYVYIDTFIVSVKAPDLTEGHLSGDTTDPMT